MVPDPTERTQSAGAPGPGGVLGDRMVADMRRRGLITGDRYLTAREAGERFGTSRATADRAMRKLEARGILERQRGRGTFVGAAAPGTSDSLEVALVLIPEFRDRLSAEGSTSLPTLLHHLLPGALVQSITIPDRDGAGVVRRVVAGSRRLGRLSWVFAISCVRDVYQILIDDSLPAIVIGSLFPDQACLPSIEVDRIQGAQLLTRHLISRGHQRLAFLPACSRRAGVHLFHDAACDVLAEAGLPANALKMRMTDGDLGIATAETAALLHDPDRPTAVIADSEALAESAARAAAGASLRVPDDLEIVHVGPLDEAHGGQRQFPCTRCTHPMGDVIGKVLSLRRRGDSVPHLTVPVELVHPDPHG